MGQFDVLPALMTLIALYFALNQRYLLVGFTLGLGTLLKVYPAFLFIFYITLIIYINRKNRIPWISMKGIKQISALVTGGLLSLLTILPFFISSGGFVDLILRRTDYQQFGGISIWSFWNIFSPGTSPDIAFPNLHITTLIYLAIFGAAILWAIWIGRGQEKQEQDQKIMLVKGNIFFIATLLVLQPLSNPQYLIWLLPLLILIAPRNGRIELLFILLSILGVLFLLSLQSFNAFFYPLASFTNIVDISTLNHNIYQYYTSTSPLSHNYILGAVIFSAVICLCTIFLPEKYDPIGYLVRRNRWGGSE